MSKKKFSPAYKQIVVAISAAGLFAGCAVGPVQPYTVDTTKIVPVAIAVQPFAVPVEKEKAPGHVLQKFEADFLPAAIASDINARKLAHAYFVGNRPPIGVDYVLSGRIVESDESHLILTAELKDICGVTINSSSYSLSSDEIRPPLKTSVELPKRVNNDIAHWVERLRSTDLASVHACHIRKLVNSDAASVSAQRLHTYEEAGALVRNQLLEPRQARFEVVVRDRSTVYEQVRSELWKMKEERSDAATKRNLQLFAGLATFAAGMAAATHGGMDSNSSNQVATVATSGIMNATSEHERMEAIQAQMDKAFSSFGTLLTDTSGDFSAFGTQIAGGKSDEQYQKIASLIQARLSDEP
jgi:hypothetical protein